jgi:hypothetical protein
MNLFDSGHFELLPNKKDRELAASIANDYLRWQGFPVHGRLLEDDSVINFSTEKTVTDTHIGLMVFVQAMGMMPYMDKKIKTESVTEADTIAAQRRTIAQLELEARRKEERNNEK